MEGGAAGRGAHPGGAQPLAAGGGGAGGAVDPIFDHLRRGHGGGVAGQQTAAHGVIAVDHGGAQAIPLEQARLGRLVLGHGAVVVQVVLRQVGQHGHGKPGAGHAALFQAVRRHFHGDGARAGIVEVGQAGLKLDGVRRSEAGGLQGIGEAGAERTDGGAARAGGLEQAGQPLRARGLAVGPGDAGHGQAACGHAMPAGGNRAGQFVQLGDRQVRHGIAMRPGVAIGFMDDGRGASGDGLVDMGPAVRGQPVVTEHVGEEHIAGLQAARIAGEPGRDRCVRTQPGQRVAGLDGHFEGEQRLGRHGVAAHGSLSCTLSVTINWRIGESGCTFSARSAPPVIAAKTGPATAPP
ncbi:hypothetical protein D3C81_1032300 [compost metagenome]